MKKYMSRGMRSVTADDMGSAAAIFAERLARRKFGRSAYCRTMRLDSWSQDGTLGEYDAFVGTTTGRNETTGSNVRFTVRAEGRGE